jgi:hypothetical protein
MHSTRQQKRRVLRMKNERLYRYIVTVGDETIVGSTFNNKREKVIRDVKGNYGHEAKNISVVWLKENTMEYQSEMMKRG